VVTEAGPGTRKLRYCLKLFYSKIFSNVYACSALNSMIVTLRKYWPVLLLVLAGCLQLGAQSTATTPPPGITRGPSVEGITEYQLQNGLRVLLFPDATKTTTTVNMAYLVGSRNENYGETGMAHLLEHMLFKGSPKHKNMPQELTEHGARPNGSTWFDQQAISRPFNPVTPT